MAKGRKMMLISMLLLGCEEEQTDLEVSQTSELEQGVMVGITEVHNVIRREHGLSDLTWDEDLVVVSEEWIDILDETNDCRMEHNWDSPYGENLYKSNFSSTNELVVQSWASEIEYYDYDSNACQPGQMCGHYTQIVWSTTERVGCAMKVCSTGEELWMCNYDPAGNWMGERPY